MMTVLLLSGLVSVFGKTVYAENADDFLADLKSGLEERWEMMSGESESTIF